MVHLPELCGAESRELWMAPAPSPERRKHTYRVGMLKGVSLACMVEEKNFQLTIQCVKTVWKKARLKRHLPHGLCQFRFPLKPNFSLEVP